jgi:glutaredoxin
LISSLVAAGVIGFAAWNLRDARVASSASSEPQPIAAVPAVAPKPQLAAATKPPEDDLTRSLRMLEDAERERRARELELQTREQAARATAATQRAREEKARDAQRHEAIKRDLEAMGLASARQNVEITMYSTSWCGVCKQARAYMLQRQIRFTEFDVDHDPAANAKQHILNPRGSVPTITVDDQLLIGFSPESLEKRIDRAARRRAGS